MAFNIVKAKQIRKKNPNKSWPQCVKEAGTLGAVKKHKKTRVGAVKSKKKGAVKISGVKRKKTGSLSGVSKHLKIVDEINKMENQYRRTSDPLKRKVLAVAINKEHDKLDRIFKK